MPLRKFPKIIGRHHKNLLKISWEHSKAGLPDPCVKVSKKAEKELIRNFFDPTSIADIMVTPHIKGYGQVKAKARQLRKAKKYKHCLW